MLFPDLQEFSGAARRYLLAAVVVFGAFFGPVGESAPLSQGEVLGKEGAVDFTRAKTNWVPAIVGQQLIVEDRLRTLSSSRAMLQLAELGRLRLNELTTLEVLPPQTEDAKATLDLKAGAMYFFSRGKPRELEIRTPHAVAASRGTEFLVTVEPGGREVFTIFDGEVQLSNPLGNLILTTGEQGAAQAGQPPVKLAAIQAVNLVQWWLYYPGVLNVDEVPLNPAEQAALAASIGNYRQGDLLAAIDSYPAGRVPQSDGEKIFYGQLLLAVGQVDQAENQITNAPTQDALSRAMRRVIAAVTLKPFVGVPKPELASEWLAKSYFQQSQFDLHGALESARAAVRKSTNFGFAWERVAELEFGFGRTEAASKALDESLRLSPRNAQAWALKGFLAAAKNRLDEATNAFQTAIDLDRGLGNGWLGRGLLRIRRGDANGGRADLQTAAAMEPNRSVLRSYLGKGFDNSGDITNATKELRLARQLDPADPTPWLYSALLLRQQLRYNEAIEDLEKSVSLNDNRRVYRSRLLLDEDRAVRNSSLATIYQNAGMNEVSLREAARAVASDYANPSAHLFLAESFNALRDPTRFNLRIETAWFNELLLANILAPVGGGNLSQNISQQEYSRLFEGNRIGFSTFTEARTDGQLRELTSQYGTVGNMGYSLDLDYQRNSGVRPNNKLDRIDWYTTIKQQITPQDSVLLLTKYQDYHSGDNFQYYDPKAPGLPDEHFKLDEFQRPLAVAAYHREWSSGSHTLLLGGRIENDQRFSDADSDHLILTKDASGVVTATGSVPFDISYRSQFAIYTSELNQIFQGEHYHFVFGGRFQAGNFETADRLTLGQSALPGLAPYFQNPPASEQARDDFRRISGYGYYTREVFANFLITAGIAYDQLTFPENHRLSPILDKSITRDKISPKASLVWSPLPELTLRSAYTRALGGVSFDESFRLEPTQLAGFNQSFRTIIPESIVGSVSAPTYETVGAAMDLKLKSRTYIGFEGDLLKSEVRREVGVFDYNGLASPPPSVAPSTTSQALDYEERSIAATFNQLVSDAWSFGAQYRFTRSELHTLYPAIATSINAEADSIRHADLHQTTFLGIYNHPSGFFARSETQWYHQSNSSYAPVRPENFYQQNFFVGYRFRRQHGEISVGVLDLNNTDYRLNPLNLYAELPRERTFVARLKINL